MPRSPKFIHPVRAVRTTVEKSQPQFAKMFGVSASYIQAIELGQRKISDELADAIMLRLGVDAESLKRKTGKPVSLIGLGKVSFTLWNKASPNRDDLDDLEKANEEYDALESLGDPNECFRQSVAFWQNRVVRSWESEQWRVRDALGNKLEMLFEAANRENKYHALAMRLSRWIEDAVTEFRLRATINVIRGTRSGRHADWPTFMETLSESFHLKAGRKEKQLKHRRRKKKR